MEPRFQVSSDPYPDPLSILCFSLALVQLLMQIVSVLSFRWPAPTCPTDPRNTDKISGPSLVKT